MGIFPVIIGEKLLEFLYLQIAVYFISWCPLTSLWQWSHISPNYYLQSNNINNAYNQFPYKLFLTSKNINTGLHIKYWINFCQSPQCDFTTSHIYWWCITETVQSRVTCEPVKLDVYSSCFDCQKWAQAALILLSNLFLSIYFLKDILKRGVTTLLVLSISPAQPGETCYVCLASLLSASLVLQIVLGVKASDAAVGGTLIPVKQKHVILLANPNMGEAGEWIEWREEKLGNILELEVNTWYRKVDNNGDFELND